MREQSSFLNLQIERIPSVLNKPNKWNTHKFSSQLLSWALTLRIVIEIICIQFVKSEGNISSFFCLPFSGRHRCLTQALFVVNMFFRLCFTRDKTRELFDMKTKLPNLFTSYALHGLSFIFMRLLQMCLLRVNTFQRNRTWFELKSRYTQM